MPLYKNSLAWDEHIDIVYVEAVVNPNDSYYYRCLPEELEHALISGEVVLAYQTKYTKTYIKSEVDDA